ncbi:MAG: BamA/TamA family outer membrane protein [Candidatus Eisenbacteria bacterium]|nr:BamA/TamA family outer membrane protein [Candidatus Eisenbacteria bacterium]
MRSARGRRRGCGAPGRAADVTGATASNVRGARVSRLLPIAVLLALFVTVLSNRAAAEEEATPEIVAPAGMTAPDDDGSAPESPFSGPVVVEDVIFPEGLTFRREELFRWMRLHPKSWGHESRFTMSDWRADLGRLEQFYRQEGFDAAEVTGLVEEERPGRVVLRVGIEEGPRWEWIQSRLVVNPARSGLRDSLRVLVPNPGEPARWRLLPMLREEMVARLAEWGRHDAEVEFLVRRDEADRRAEIKVVVHAGPLVRAEGLRIDGVDKTRRDVVRRELLVRDGDPLRLSELRRSEERLRNLGIFSDVKVGIAPYSHRHGFRAVHVRVEEAPGGRLASGFGYGSIDRLHLGASIEQANFHGRAIRLAVGMVVGQERRMLEAGAFLPWVLHRRVGLRLSTTYEKVFPSRYEIERERGEVALVREIEEVWKLELGFLAERARVLSSKADRDDKPVRIGQLGVALSKDTRDRLLGPTRGRYVRFSHDWVSPLFGSSEDFTRIEFQVRGYHPLGAGVLGQARALVGVLRSHESGNEIPLSERFFAGGTEDLRGFPGDGIGPQDDSGEPEGGRILFLGGVEAEHRVWRSVGIAGFVDIGQLENRQEDLRLSRLSVGAGAGLRWRSRLGYARADIGFPLTDRFAGPPRFHFSTGTTFF